MGRPPGTQKEPEPVVAARLSPKTRKLLETEARRNKRTLSREVEARLDYAFGRYQKFKVEGRPPHIMALSDAVAVAARVMEETTGRPWNKDQYTSEHLARLICAVMADFTQPGEVTIPKKLSRKLSAILPATLTPLSLGEDKAKGIIALIRLRAGFGNGGGQTILMLCWKSGKSDAILNRRGGNEGPHPRAISWPVGDRHRQARSAYWRAQTPLA